MCSNKHLKQVARAATPASMGVAVVVFALGLGVRSEALAASPDKVELNSAQLVADTDGSASFTLAQADKKPSEKPAEEAKPSETVAERSEVETKQVAEDEGLGLPVTVSISYYLLSDYIYRGANFSEFRGEGREDLNHQMTTSIALDLKKLGLGDIGTFGFDTFWEWYARQKKLNPDFGGGQNLQEADFQFWWEYHVEQIATDIRIGWWWYTFPNSAGLLRSDKAHGNDNNDRTAEWNIKFSHNDAWAWKWLFPDNDDGILNPYFFFAQDVTLGSPSIWMEIGFSHPFTIPGVDNLTITPGWTVAIDGGWLKHALQRPNADHLQFAYQLFSLNVTYDLTPILKLPKWAGSVSVSGLLYFQDAWGLERDNSRDSGVIQDEFYGGMSVNWTWGG